VKATGELKTCETRAIRYFVNGKATTETTGSTNRADAVRLLSSVSATWQPATGRPSDRG